MPATVDPIKIKDVGPNRELTIPLPAGGGVVVLKARNDLGKSVALDSVEALITGEGTIEKRVGSTRGEISLGEAMMTVTKQARRSGQLEVVALDSKLKVADLVDPGIADPEKADTYRIKAYLTMVGQTADQTVFYPLLGGKEAFDAIVTPAALKKAGDIVELAAAIKRDIEAAARTKASLAEQEAGHAQGHREAAKGYDAAIETDQEELDRELHEAIAEKGKIDKWIEDAAAAEKKAVEARAKIAAKRAEYKGPTVAEADEAYQRAGNAVTIQQASVKALEQKLSEARIELSKREAVQANLGTALTGAQGYEDLIAEWEATVKAGEVVYPSPDQFDKAGFRSVTAREAVEAGALNRERKKRVKDAEQAENAARGHREQCEELRQAARGIDDVLSGLLAASGSPLRVEGGRLVIDDEKDGSKRVVPYSELSDGRRTRIAVGIAVAALARAGKPALLTLPQRFWSELDVFNRAEVDECAKAMNCHILTAEATQDPDDDGTMKVEQFSQAV